MHNYTGANHLEVKPDATFEKTSIAVDHFHELIRYANEHGKYLGSSERNGIIQRFFLLDETGFVFSYDYNGNKIKLQSFNPNEEKAKSVLELIISKVELPENPHLGHVALFSA